MVDGWAFLRRAQGPATCVEGDTQAACLPNVRLFEAHFRFSRMLSQWARLTEKAQAGKQVPEGHSRSPGCLLTSHQEPEGDMSCRSKGSPRTMGWHPAHRPTLIPLLRVAHQAGVGCQSVGSPDPPGTQSLMCKESIPPLPPHCMSEQEVLATVPP